MTSMLGQQGSDGGLDLIAVNRDADLLDLLARRAPVPAGDPALAMLAAFAADIDEGLDELLVASDDDPLVQAATVATVVPHLPAARRRGLGLRATTIAIVVGTTLSIGGVAAAVTGDPLAPVKGIATAVGLGADTHEAKNNARNADQQARSRLSHGDVAGAQAALAMMRAQLLRDDLSHGDRRSIQARVDALQKQVDRTVAALGSEPRKADSNGKSQTTDGKGQTTDGKGESSGGKATSDKPVSKPTTKPTSRPSRTTEPGAGAQSGSGGGGTRPSEVGSGSRELQSSPSASDDSEDAPASTTADPSTSTGGTGKAIGSGSGAGSGAGAVKADAKGTSAGG